jgi:hypothetical protein
MSKRERRERLPPFVPLLKSTLGSPAWRAMFARGSQPLRRAESLLQSKQPQQWKAISFDAGRGRNNRLGH